MTFDPEAHQRARAEEKARAMAEIAALYADLESALNNPSRDAPALERQADLLDRLLYTLMRRTLNKDKANGNIDQDAMEFTLRVQKQCVDTIRTVSAIEYMQAIMPLRIKALPPPPAKDERTDKET